MAGFCRVHRQCQCGWAWLPRFVAEGRLQLAEKVLALASRGKIPVTLIEHCIRTWRVCASTNFRAPSGWRPRSGCELHGSCVCRPSWSRGAPWRTIANQVGQHTSAEPRAEQRFLSGALWAISRMALFGRAAVQSPARHHPNPKPAFLGPDRTFCRYSTLLMLSARENPYDGY
jgi:hypothetical protein